MATTAKVSLIKTPKANPQHEHNYLRPWELSKRAYETKRKATADTMLNRLFEVGIVGEPIPETDKTIQSRLFICHSCDLEQFKRDCRALHSTGIIDIQPLTFVGGVTYTVRLAQ